MNPDLFPLLHKVRRRLRKAVGRGRDRARIVAAFVWRRLMLRTTVVAITGSVGKTTTKECLAAILSAHGRTLKTADNQNCALGVPRTLLAMRPWHRYAVIEVGTAVPGQMARSARLVKPHVAVMLAIARTHTNNFRTLDDTAAEKSALLGALARCGTAILNGDDDRVRRMAKGCRGKVVIFGRTVDCDLVAEEMGATWPERLHFTARSGAERVPVRTQLVGAHWVSTSLAVLAAARACGVRLTAAADGLASVAPFAGRMQPVALPCGAVVIRDEENGSPDTLDAMLAVLRDAPAKRRVLVFSDVSDSKANPRKRLRDMGKVAAALVDVAVFVGEHAHHGVRGAVAAGMDPASCHDVLGPQRAAELLARELRPGDLVFVKGRSTHHLSRIIFAQFGPIGCWTTSCKKRPVCDVCDELRPEFDLQRALAVP